MERLGRWASASLDDHEIQELQLRAAALGAANGVTSAHEMSMPHWLGLRDLQVFLGHRERLPMDVEPVVATMDIPQIMDLGLPSIGGDLPMDGSIGARTAAIMAPYADSPEAGITYHDDEELAGFFHAGHMAGLQVGVHAIGDRAIEQVLAAWERVYAALDSRERRHFRARRHRIEHFEMAACRADRAGGDARSGGVGAAGVRSVLGCAGWAVRARGLGSERAATMNPFRTMIDRGIEVGRGLGQLRSRRWTRCCRSRPARRIMTWRNDSPGSKRSGLHTSGRRTTRAPGGEEGGARSGHARGLRGVRRGSAPWRASKGCARSSRCRSDARCLRVERRSPQRRM